MVNNSNSTNTGVKEVGTKAVDFIRVIINEHLRTNKYGGRVVTRFPPEPNGFLHIGHAKSICLNFGIALEYGGACHLRFDDTDPTKEDILYVNSIQQDVKWLGFDWGDKLFYASDYFEKLYQYAIKLIKDGKAYVCSLSDPEIKEYRGTVTEPGKNSPYRERSIEENLDIFQRMHAGEFLDGAHVLRARIDMSSPNMKMRDPLLYRIRHAHHYRQGDKWCIYPMYDFAHCLSDYIEGITHSICTLEFENNRELYDWILDELNLEPPRPYQYEFARLNLNYTVVSKRKLLELVERKIVNGWDDPRLHTIAGLRRRGYTPESIRNFCDSIGIAKANSTVDMAHLEFSIRDDLNRKVPRVLAVLRPLKVIIDNYPEGKTEILDAPLYPHDVPLEGSRPLPFSKVIYIERDDFMESPPKGFYRLAPGKEVRLRHAYIIKCEKVIKDEKTGEIIELHCSYDPETKSGSDKPVRNIKGTIHWVSAEHAHPAELRLYDRLFKVETPDNLDEDVNPDSLEIVNTALVEPEIARAEPGSRFQFERMGYFFMDPIDSKDENIVFNRIVQLKDSWSRAVQPSQESVKTEGKAVKQKETTVSSLTAPVTPVMPSVYEMTPEIEARHNKFNQEYGLAEDEALLIARDAEVSCFYEDAIKAHNNPKDIANWIINVLLAELKETPVAALPFSADQLAELVSLIDDNTISNKIAKDILLEMLVKGGHPKQIVEERGLRQLTDSTQIEPIIEKVIKANPENVAKYKEGRSNLLGFFVGQVMKETAGKANPKLVNDLILAHLEKI